MSSGVKITRAHRIAALEALGWADTANADQWPDVGGDTLTRTNKYIGQHVTSMVEESAVALAIATAEHNLRAAVIADLRGILSRAHKGDYLNRVMVVDADSIENLIDTLEAQS